MGLTFFGGAGSTIATGKPVTKRRTAGNVTVTSTTWSAVDAALDITMPAKTGDLIQVGLSALVGDTVNAFLFFDVGTVVSSAVVNRAGGSEGISAWIVPGSARFPSSGSILYSVVSGDLSSGLVTLRLLAQLGSASSRSLGANTFDPLDFWACNLGPKA